MTKFNNSPSSTDELREKLALPAGSYPARVVYCEEKEGNTGPYWLTTWRIVGGDHDAKEAVDFIGFGSDPRDELGRRQTFESVGIKLADGANDLDPNVMLDKTAVIETYNKERNGELQAKVRGVFPLKGDLPATTGKTDSEQIPF